MSQEVYASVPVEDSPDISGEKTRVAFLNLPGIGSKFFDPEAFKGYVEYLRENPVDKIILTGVLPKIPEFMGRRSAENLLRALDRDIYGKHGEDILQAVRAATDDPDVDGIKNLHYAALVSREYIKMLRDATDAELVYIWNENDFQNANWRIANIKRRKKDLERTKKQLEAARAREEGYLADLEALSRKIEEYRGEIFSLSGQKGAAKSRSDDKGLKKIEGKLKKYRALLSKVKSKRDEIKQSVIGVRREIDAYERMIEDSAIDRYYNLGLIRDATELWDIADLARTEYMLYLKTALGEDVDLGILRDEERLQEFLETIKGEERQFEAREAGKREADSLNEGLEDGVLEKGDVLLFPYGAIEVEVGGEIWLISQNFNYPNSSVSIRSNISRNLKLLKRYSRSGKKARYMVELGPHVGPFRMLQYNLGSDGRVVDSYIISLPKFANDKFKAWFKEALGKFLKVPETKRKYLPSFTGAVVVETGDRVAVEVLSHEFLKRKYRGGEEDRITAFLVSDLHIGAPNANPDKLTNFEVADTLMDYMLRNPRDYVIFLGDIFDGSHRPEITNRMGGPGPMDAASAFERAVQRALRGELPEEEFLRTRRIVEGFALKEYGRQVREFKYRYGGAIEQLLETAPSRIAFVSGNHTNKTVNFTINESTILEMIIPAKFTDRVYAISGSRSGAGYLRGELGGRPHRFYLSHRPGWKGPDLLTIMADHLSELSEYADLFAAGDKHQAGVGFVEETPLVAVPSGQQQNSYGDYLAKEDKVRGGMDVTIYRIPGEHHNACAMRAEFITEGRYLDRHYRKYIAPKLLEAIKG